MTQMESINRSIARQFSQGDFAAAYLFFSNAVEWEIVGDQVLKGKESVIDFCTNMTSAMDGSVLANENYIETENQIAIQGRCSYLNEAKQESLIQYCDIYVFENSKIKRITSYCIDKRV